MIFFIKKFYWYWKRKRLFPQINFKKQNIQIEKGVFNVSGNISISNDVYIGPYASFSADGKIEIGRGTIFGPHCTIYSSSHRYDAPDLQAIPYDGVSVCGQVVIDEGCWIGGNAIILPGTHVAKGCVIGAGSVVLGTFPCYSVICGNPAKIVKSRNAQIYDDLSKSDKFYLKLKRKGKMRYSKTRKKSKC